MEQFLFYTKKTDTGFIKKLGLFALFLLFGLGAKAQCPTGNVGLYSQADVNNFATNYPNCTEITGNLTISGSDITDLSPLSNLTQIGGVLSIYSNSQLNSLNGLDNLTQIGGVLYISDNSQLTNLDELSNLTSVGADLVIQFNYSLTDISGLQNIDPNSILSTYFGVGLQIVGNTSLSVCNLPNFCTYLQGSGPRTIADNAGDCISEAAVTTACSPAPPCDAPTNLTATNITSVSATLNWSGTGTYDIEWGTQGFTPGSGTSVTGIASNSYSLTDLDYNTQYQFYVRCQSEPNQWAGPFVFTTLPQCPTGNVILNSQTQVNDFGTNYPNCTEITGNLQISGSTITDLSPLSNIQSIGGYLNISSNSQLTDIDGLSNLTQIGGYLSISSNSQLTNLDGLSNLTQIGGYLYIVNNSQLTNLDGLSNLTQIGGYLYIQNNAVLENLDGLSALESINGDLVIFNNAVLTDISGLQNIDPATILPNSYGLYIQYNPLLSVCNLDNFCTYLAGSGLRTISGNAGDCISEAAVNAACTTSSEPQCPTGDVGLYSQADVNNFATNYPNCTEITGYLYIVGSDITDLSPLSNIQSIGGDLFIYNNSQLTNLDGLSNLTEIGGALFIYNNSQLTNLDGLSNLTSIEGYLLIQSNSSLTDISGLQNIDPNSISANGVGLYIVNNSSLSVCNLDNFCTYLAGSGLRTISGNAGDCVSVTAVTTACTTSQEPQCPTGDVGLYSQADVNNFATNYPNCTEITGYLYIVGSDITDLSPLSNIQSIGGYLNIYNNSQLTNLDGLSNLTSVGGYLDIYDNLSLTNLDGLSNLTSIGTDLAIYTNSALTDISGLQNIDPNSISYLLVVGNPLLSVCNLPNFCTYLQGSGPRNILGNAGDCISEAAVNAACTTSSEPQCPTGDVGLYSQADVNNFATNYPNCTETSGGLYIYGNDITDLSPLSNLTSIGGNLGIYNSSNLTNLDGLSNLTSVGGDFLIQETNLTNLDGISNLTSVGGFLNIAYNQNLTNLDGLSSLTSIEGYLLIQSNSSLTDISGLQNIDPNSISANGVGLYILNNPLLSVCNLDNFCTYLAGSGARTISGNAGDCISEAAVNAACSPAPPCDAPTNLSTSNVTSVSATLGWSGTGTYDIEWGTQGFTPGSGTSVTGIASNSYSLTDLDYNTQYQFYVRCQSEPANWVGPFAFTTLSQCPTGYVSLTSQAEVDAFGVNYPNCTEITGSLHIGGSYNYGSTITDLSPLNNIQSIGDDLYIQINPQLTDIDGLSNLTQIVGFLYISSNSQLTNLDGLSNLTEIGGYFTIQHNAVLENLDGLSALESINGDLFIHNNAVLTDISGLQNIDPDSIFLSHNGVGLYIRNNPLLSVCNLPNFCTYLSNPDNPRNISGNAGDCISEAAVNAACAPACEAPTNLTATATSISATLGWTSTGNNFDIEWGVAGFTQGSGTTVTDITTNSYNLTSLSSNTQYQFYVRQDCTLNQSDWVGPISFTTLSQCPTGDVNLNSQAEVDAFAINYPNCTEITGDLYIVASTVVHLDGLSNLTSVGGDFLIQETNLTNLDGISNLTSVGGFLNIAYNQNLTNLDGLSSLTSIGGDLFIQFNSSLTDISGLQNIDPTSILPTYGYGLYIVSNSSLSVCNLENFCTYLQGSGPRTISGNAGDCISEAAVNAACTTSSEPQCPTGDVYLNFQAEVDAFAINYPNCTEVSGNLTIQGANITDLTPLSNLTSVGGYLNIYYNSNLTNLDGLSNLTSVGGYLHINSNSNLTNLDGLSNLTSVGGNLDIYDNLSLTNLDGLNNLTSVGGYLNINYNSNLTNLDGLSNLTSVGGYLYINSNSNLTNLDGLSNLTSVGADLVINSNYSLTDISGLQNIDPNSILSSYFGIGLYITGNPLLSVCNLDNFCTYLAGSGPRTISGNAGDCISEAAVNAACTTSSEPQCPTGDVALYSQADVNNFATNYPNCTEISGYLYITGSTITDLSPLSNLTSVGGYLSIYSNSNLTNLDGLSNLTSVGGFLLIDSNSNLTSLNGLSNLTSVGADLVIKSNYSLTDISGLQNIDPTSILSTYGYGLYIVGNTSLSVCNLPNFCTYLQGSGPRTISLNAGDCISEAAVNAACNPAPPCDAPANLTVSGIINNKATINWTNSGTFDLKWGAENFTDGNELGTANGVTELNYEITGLTANTAYDVYVRQNCDVNQSDWVKYTFSTTVQCPSGYVNLLSQTQVSNFLINYPNCTHLPGSLHIQGNNIANLTPLSNLVSIGQHLTISGNPALTSLNGLSSLTFIGGELEFYNNNQLTDISALQNVEGMTSLYVVNNSSLSDCDIDSFCSYLSNPDNPRTISGNAGNCITEEAITLICFPPTPSCEVPTNLATTNITADSATLNWESDGASFEIVWGALGFDPEGATPITDIDTTSYTISEGLNAGTQYDFYVRQYCTDDDIVSDWAGPFGFATSVAECPSGDVVFNTQAELDAFAIEYPNCTHISGSLFVSGAGNNITDLSPLNAIVSVSGPLMIMNNFYLTNIDGLSSLTTVGGHLQITNNYWLTDLDGLSNLTSLGADITIAYNDNLASVSGLSGLTTINPVHNEGLRLFENESLTTCEIDVFCDYLSQDSETHPREIYNNGANCNDEAEIYAACNPPVACSDGDVYINSQEDLDDYVANYPLCTIINGSLFIEESDISDLSGLNNIETIIGDLYISGNQQLTTLNGLSSLETIGGGLFIWVNDNLQDVDGLYSLRTIEGMLSIDSNPLENLNGLNALENIGDELMIAFTGLSNLDGLSNLTHLGADITIAFNDNLESVSGLSGLTTLIPLYEYGLQIFNNPSLSTCNLSVFCDYLSNDPETHPRYIEDNAGDCISEEAVQESCEDMTYGDCDFYTIWNGSQWSHGAPNAETGIVIKGNLNLTEDLEVCDVWIISGVLSVEPGVQLTLNGAIVNNMSADYFLVQSDAVLIQMEGVENLGEITVIRESQDMIRLDYTLWSSPVIGQNLFGFSPETVNGITNYLGSTGRIYVYDGENGYVNPDPFTVASEMENGVGYLFRAPNNWSDTEAAPYIGVFTGAPNNGDIQVTTHAGNYTSIGNPYPSNIRLNDLYVANPDINAVYFWNNTQSTGNNYATCTNGMGCVAAAGGGNTPDGIITTGQGFIVHTDANSVSFDNSMRVNDSGIFFKVDELESHRFWLNLDGEEESYNQTLIGYVSEATNQVDAQIDAKLFNYSGSALYNLIEEESYVIQGRALPFETADEVPLGFRAAQSGKFKISLADFDGLFVEGSVSIYLKDNQLDITHNLMESDYEFESVQGEFKERFEVVYETEETMGTGEFDSNLVQIYQDNGNIIIESKNEKILSVELFDLNGRNLHRNPKVNANHYEIQTKAFGTQVLVVKVQAENGEILTKKLISK